MSELDNESMPLLEGTAEYIENENTCEKAEIKTEEPDSDAEYYPLPEARFRTLLWSLLSVIFAVLSVALCPFYIPAIVLSVLSVALSLYSRWRLGYFDKMALVGLIVGIFGIVFGIGSLCLTLSGVMDRLLR